MAIAALYDIHGNLPKLEAVLEEVRATRSSLMRSGLLIPIVILVTGTPAAAQGPAYRGDIFGAVGLSRMGGDEGSLGSGPHVLGGVGLRLAPRTMIEVDVMRTHHERDIAGGPLEGTATGVFGSGVYRFSEGRMQIFVMGSVGLLRSRTTHTYPFAGTPTTFTSDDHGFAWGGGGGVEIFLRPRFSMRPQFRLVVSEATGIMGLAAGAIGIAYHW